MRISDLYEADTSTTDYDWIKQYCSHAIERYKNGDIIYKDIDNARSNVFVREENDYRRTVRHLTSNLHTSIVNNSAMFKGYLFEK